MTSNSFDINLDGDWDFAYEPKLEWDSRPVPPSRFEATMPVPGYWDDHVERVRSSSYWSTAQFNPGTPPIAYPTDTTPDAVLPHLLGIGWYRNTFALPAPTGQAVTLRVGGVRLEAWVWCNGAFVGHQLGQSTPFAMALDPWIKPGERNELIIAVSNARTDRGGCSLVGFQGQMGGIYRSVSLHIADQICIRDLHVYPRSNNQELVWSLEVAGQDTASWEAEWFVRERASGQLLASGSTHGSGERAGWISRASQITPWSDRNPALHEVGVRLKIGDRVRDEVWQPFGLRSLTRDGVGLRLNGNPVYLRGVCSTYYFPLTCTAPADVESYRALIRRHQALGFNWIRFHTWTPSEEYMQAADELGMMIQVEPPVGFGAKEWVDILRTCRKHPSVVIYCCGNEELLDEPKIESLREMAALCHQHAPDTLFNPQEALRGIEYLQKPGQLGPDAVEEPYPHNPRRLAALKEFSDVFGNYAWGLLSYESARGDWRLVEERLAAYERPCLSHELCLHGTYINLDLEHRYVGTRIGPHLFAAARKHLQEQGLLGRAALYHRNSCASMRMLRKHCVEMARLCAHVAGYDLLGGQDQHGHRTGYDCGVMNEFGEVKYGETDADVRRYNNENVLLLDHQNQFTWRAGETFAHDLYVSIFGATVLTGAEVSWHLADDKGCVYARGRFQCAGARVGEITRLGTASFVMPPAARPLRLTLRARVSSAEMELENWWHLWVFPKLAAQTVTAQANDTVRRALQPCFTFAEGTEAPLRIVSALSEVTLQFLEAGGRVIVLGTSPFPADQIRFQTMTPGRPNGNFSTVIADHPLLREFQHDGFCDWQFRSLLDFALPVTSNDTGLPFDPIIEIVSSYKNIRKQSVLFEYRVGAGRLLVCTCTIDLSDPATTWLLDRMISYVGSDRFQPRTEASVSVLRGFVAKPGRVQDYYPSDQAFDPSTLRVRKWKNV